MRDAVFAEYVFAVKHDGRTHSVEANGTKITGFIYLREFEDM